MEIHFHLNPWSGNARTNESLCDYPEGYVRMLHTKHAFTASTLIYKRTNVSSLRICFTFTPFTALTALSSSHHHPADVIRSESEDDSIFLNPQFSWTQVTGSRPVPTHCTTQTAPSTFVHSLNWTLTTLCSLSTSLDHSKWLMPLLTQQKLPHGFQNIYLDRKGSADGEVRDIRSHWDPVRTSSSRAFLRFACTQTRLCLEQDTRTITTCTIAGHMLCLNSDP